MASRPISPRLISVNIDQPDPTNAINAFLWNMARARELGFLPKTEHMLAEHLFREDAKVVYYSSACGITSLVEGKIGDEEPDFDDTMGVIDLINKRKLRAKAALKSTSAKREMCAADLECPQ